MAMRDTYMVRCLLDVVTLAPTLHYKTREHRPKAAPLPEELQSGARIVFLHSEIQSISLTPP
jgi:hypothetical protein